ncbi:hypothetical protein [Mycobacterium interjectum]|nr:hypothetical protein [Mycobacterium interjectum]MCV7092141.1 hypothetical protein [Mycobacterium interjectum]
MSPGEIPIKVGYERAAETTCTVNRVDAAVQPPAHRSAEHGRRIEKWRTR